MSERKNSTKNLVNLALEGIENLKGKEIVLLDMRDIDAAICDYFILCNGTSNTHVNSIVNSVRKTIRKETQERPWSIEGSESGEWVLMDYIDVVVHVFQKHIRDYYDLEGLWGDAKVTVIEGE